MAALSPRRITLDMLVPGGVLPTDHIFSGTHDDTCSRCRKPIADETVPLILWIDDARPLAVLCYCEACTSEDAFAALAPTAPS